MKILVKGTMPNGTPIQIEEWNEDYGFMPYADTIAAYPKSKISLDRAVSPKRNKTFRCQFNFNSETETRNAFNALLNGSKELADFKKNLYYKEYADCI